MNATLRRVKALASKDLMDLFKNPTMFVVLLMPIGFMLLFRLVLGDASPSAGLTGSELEAANHEIAKYLLGSGLCMAVGMVVSMVLIYGIAEEKEKEYQKLCERDEKNLHLVLGLPEFLDLLQKEHVPVAICTASMKPNVDWYEKTFHLERWFDDGHIIYDDGTLTKGKPDPMIYNRAIKALNVKAEDCLVFEDALSGILSARNAKVGMVVEIDDVNRRDKPPVEGLVDLVLADFRKVPKEIKKFLEIE